MDGRKTMTMPRIIGGVALLLIGVAGVAPRAASRSEIADAVMKGDRTAVRTLLQRKADVNAPQVDGATALHWAVYRDDLETANVLIRAGAKPDVANREGVTPLAMASRNGSPQAIKLLFAAGADVNAKEKLRGTTALMWAVDQKHPAAVKVLVELGADVSARSGPAGLPRNYMAPRVRTDAVDAAARRYAAAAAAGRTYQEQLEWEAANGMKISLGFRGTLNAGGARVETNATAPPGPPPGQNAAGSASPAPAAPAPPPDAPERENAPALENADEADVIVAGLVGAGGGGLTAMVLAARENDVESV